MTMILSAMIGGLIGYMIPTIVFRWRAKKKFERPITERIMGRVVKQSRTGPPFNLVRISPHDLEALVGERLSVGGCPSVPPSDEVAVEATRLHGPRGPVHVVSDAIVPDGGMVLTTAGMLRFFELCEQHPEHLGEDA